MSCEAFEYDHPRLGMTRHVPQMEIVGHVPSHRIREQDDRFQRETEKQTRSRQDSIRLQVVSRLLVCGFVPKA